MPPVAAPAIALSDLEPEKIEYGVEAARLDHGEWCHKTNTTVRQGEIVASYSADRIANGESVRQPFACQGAMWICTGSGPCYAEAVRIVPGNTFQGEPTTYADKTRYYHDTDSDTEKMSARQDPKGFYHDMKVKRAGRAFVRCGPQAEFVPGGEADQMNLFGAM